MGHELRPRAGQLPPASEVVRLLSGAFAYVKADAQDGSKQARARADWIERAPARLFFGQHQQALAFAARLRKLGPDDALTIEFGDGPEKTLKIVVIPEEPIKFSYRSPDEEVSSRELVERCA